MMALALAAVLSADTIDNVPRMGCAAASLFALYTFTGQPTSIEELQSHFPSGSPATLNTVKASAEAMNRPVRFYAVKKGGRLPSDPFLLYKRPQREGGVGHLVCVRLLDSRGRQFQVIDPPFETDIRTETELLDDPRFGEIVGVRERVNILANLLTALGVVGILTFGVLSIRRRGRNKD